MQDGLAYICLITSNLTITRAKIDVNIPKKRKGNAKQNEKVCDIHIQEKFQYTHFLIRTYVMFQGILKFYELIMQGLLRHVNFDVVKIVLIASPGFLRDQFYNYLLQQSIKNDIKILIENKHKFLLVHSSTGFKHSLKGNATSCRFIISSNSKEKYELCGLQKS